MNTPSSESAPPSLVEMIERAVRSGYPHPRIVVAHIPAPFTAAEVRLMCEERDSEIARLQTERDEARETAKLWEADSLFKGQQLLALNENKITAEAERDAAREQVRSYEEIARAWQETREGMNR